jgi:hypothetical protein
VISAGEKRGADFHAAEIADRPFIRSADLGQTRICFEKKQKRREKKID